MKVEMDFRSGMEKFRARKGLYYTRATVGRGDKWRGLLSCVSIRKEGLHDAGGIGVESILFDSRLTEVLHSGEGR